MSIAVYDEDPVPYRYTSYLVLEQLVPMRKFEYQSPRHNQGVDYGLTPQPRQFILGIKLGL